MKKPNFDFERRERNSAKAAKKAAKADAKAVKKEADEPAASNEQSETDPVDTR